MNPDLKARWIADLRANADLQGRGSMRTIDGKYCCLGRLCEIAGFIFNLDREQYFLPEELEKPESDEIEGFNGEFPAGVLIKLELGSIEESKLIKMNDKDHLTFPEIANWIERNL